MDHQMGASYVSGNNEENRAEEILPRGSFLKIEHIVKYAMRKVSPQHPEQTEQLIKELLVRIEEYQEEGRRDALTKYEGQLKDMATKIINQRQTIADLQQHIDSNGSPAFPLSSALPKVCTARYGDEGAEKTYCTFIEGHDRQYIPGSQNHTPFDHGNPKENIWWDNDYTYAIPEKPAHLPLTSIDVTGVKITDGQKQVMTPPRDATYGQPYVGVYHDSKGDIVPLADPGSKPFAVADSLIPGLPPLICKDGIHYVGDVLPQPAPGQALEHDGCQFTGVSRRMIKDHPLA